MNRRFLLLAAAGLAGTAALLSSCGGHGAARAAEPAPPVNTLLRNGSVAIQGTDPVAYFTLGRPLAGSPEHATRHNGATWLFATAEHKTLFERDPRRYEPAYGGYCAFGVANGYLVRIDPEAWTVHEGRLYLNYDLTVRQRWLRDVSGYNRKADALFPELLKRGLR